MGEKEIYDMIGALDRRVEALEKGGPKKDEYPITCSECGKDSTVPFKPKEGWSVKCRDCYKEARR